MFHCGKFRPAEKVVVEKLMLIAGHARTFSKHEFFFVIPFLKSINILRKYKMDKKEF